MRSLETAEPGTWRADLSDRQIRLAATLRSLSAAASTASDGSWCSELAVIAQRWDAETTAPEDIGTLLGEVDEARETVARQLVARPLLAARRVNVSLGRVQVASSLADVVRLAPAELCWAGDFDRVLFSRIEGSSWLPAAWHVASDPLSSQNLAFGDFVRDSQIPLSNGMIETEIVRRRVPVLVNDAVAEARTLPAFIEIAGCRSYVIAPVIAGELVVGLLHADTHASGRPLAETDRVTLRAFADGVGLILERLALLERLSSQRTQISAALAAAGQAVDDLCSAPVNLTPHDIGIAPEAESTADGPLEVGLTAREREVFAVLVSGATNAQIADRLTVSETTVKSHVKHILRKLRAANRAEAISRYLVMTNNNARTGL